MINYQYLAHAVWTEPIDPEHRAAFFEAVAALVESGVTFRTASNDDGTLDCWQQPKLPAWEVPKRYPDERRPQAPDVAARRRAERGRWRVRQRVQVERSLDTAKAATSQSTTNRKSK